MKAAIYNRVSTDSQELEGSSLDTQLEACRSYCQNKGYEITHRFSEVYSGLLLERPRLDELRELIRAKEIDVVVIYCLDRLSRHATHGVILRDELDKYHVVLESVTEDIDKTPLGEAITYLRGTFSQIEAEKIRERTMRGRRARALSGKLPANSHARLYGYNYIPGKGIGEGVRYINEEQSHWVKQMFFWLVSEGLSTSAITYRLRDLGVPTPSGRGHWMRSTVLKIIKNPSYCGHVYTNTCTYGEPSHHRRLSIKHKKTSLIKKPREEWIEIKGACPAIISEELFEKAQEQLSENARRSKRNKRVNYLLSGHITCARCGRAFWGVTGPKPRNPKHNGNNYYQCSGRLKKVTPIKCNNHRHSASRLEFMVWEGISNILRNPKLVFQALCEISNEGRATNWQDELDRVERIITNRQRQKDRIHKAFYLTGDEVTFKQDIAQNTKELEQLESERASIYQKIEIGQKAELDFNNLKAACKLWDKNLDNLSFEQKRFVLDALNVRLVIDGDSITANGTITPLDSNSGIVTTTSSSRCPTSTTRN